MPDDAPVTMATRPASWGSGIEHGVEARLHAGERHDRPAKRVAHEPLLRGRLHERRDGLLGVAPVLLLGLDVDLVELERLVRDVVLSERLQDHRGAVRAPGYLHLHPETEGAEAFFEGGPAECAQHAGGSDRRREREMRPRLGFVDAEPREELHVEVAVITLGEEAELAGKVAGDQPRAVALDGGGWVREPGSERRDARLHEVVHLFRPAAELCGGELPHQKRRVEATDGRVSPFEVDTLIEELPWGWQLRCSAHGSLLSAASRR